jgi:hypothetical protein
MAQAASEMTTAMTSTLVATEMTAAVTTVIITTWAAAYRTFVSTVVKLLL